MILNVIKDSILTALDMDTCSDIKTYQSQCTFPDVPTCLYMGGISDINIPNTQNNPLFNELVIENPELMPEIMALNS